MADRKEYVKLWLSYADYFKSYSDVEVGRLVRAMITYRASGEEPKFNGNERYIWPAIKRDIDEAVESKQLADETRRENGKKGGRPKSANPSEEPLTGVSETEKTEPVFEEPKKPKGQGTKDEGQGTKDNGQWSMDKDDGDYGGNAALAIVKTAYLDKINPTPSQASLDELQGYVEQMGAECCLRAFDIALDNKTAKWSYIRGILRSKLSKGVRCLADWDELEAKRNKEKQQKQPATSKQGTPVVSEQADEDMGHIKRMMKDWNQKNS